MKKKIYNILFCLLIFILTILVFINPNLTSNYFFDCLMFIIKIIIPSLFPFMIFINFILYSNCIDYISKFFSPIGRIFKLSGYGISCVIASILGGFPYSAILVSSFVKANKISNNEARRIINYCFFPSISFLFSGLLGIDKKFIYVIISLYISSFFMLLISSIKEKRSLKYKNDITINNDVTSIYYDVMDSSIKSISNISFCILFFNIITMILSLFIKDEKIIYYISGIFEFSNSSINILMFDNKTFIDYFILNIIISFSSFSILFQSMYFLKEINIKIKQLLLSRLVIVLLSSIIFTILYFI